VWEASEVEDARAIMWETNSMLRPRKPFDLDSDRVALFTTVAFRFKSRGGWGVVKSWRGAWPNSFI
jgi:hypothetical protein